ncbi:MAG: adenylosuccinate lyase [Candidatus Saganbacteria bacterium]|nr:adenylosuccinate lyase [Candidatus Saganbacteria bacterium]
MIDRYTLPKMGAIWNEQAKFQSWLDVELAVCEVWSELGKIPGKSLENIRKNASFSIERINEIEKIVDHDLIAFTTCVAEKVGEDSRYIHIGLTSYDVEDTALSLRLKASSDIIIEDIEKTIVALKKRAGENKGTMMMGRTHGVHAEPITFAFKLCVWIAEMERNLERMKKAKESVNVGKISGAVGSYANLEPKIEEMVCNKLGLKPSPASTQVLQRDRIAEYMATLALIAGSLEKFATEIRNLSRTEILEVEEPFKKGQKGSSAMPHKKNPIISERITSLARVIRGNCLAAMENIPLWHERDLSNSAGERIIIPDSNILIDYMLNKFTSLMDGLVVHPENMLANIERSGGIVFSQRILLTLVDSGLTREDAYKIVQACAMEARSKGRPMKDVCMQDSELQKHIPKDKIEGLFDLNYFTRNLYAVYKRFGL